MNETDRNYRYNGGSNYYVDPAPIVNYHELSKHKKELLCKNVPHSFEHIPRKNISYKEDLLKRRVDVLRNKFECSENSEFDFYDNVEAVFSRGKNGKKVLAVVCEDMITTERLLQLNSFFNRKEIRWVNIYVDSEKISVGPFVIPGVTSCIECHCDRSAFEYPHYYGFNCTDITSNRLAASVFANELFFIAGNICEYLIKDVSLTLCRQFIIKKRDFIVYQNEIAIDCSCSCHRSEV